MGKKRVYLVSFLWEEPTSIYIQTAVYDSTSCAGVTVPLFCVEARG